ncbi:HNH endonuclease [Rhodococcus sp. OK302]|uniref:HNH endonuclease n=1 Tax=Rhodococcus sp. OK302 TaxID=1882769 RepID=UPI000B9F5516|nr:HNH endonuclease [Rhodococcus sp. OK302]OYD69273.1 HNH endonuclease [Rhodococcus sp. OK302]
MNTMELDRAADGVTERGADKESERAAVDNIGVEICALAGQIAAATARFLALLGDFDEQRGWTGPGLHSCAHWLSWKCGLSLHTGREYVRVAKALRPLPKMQQAFEQGRLSYSKVRALTRVATPANEAQMVRMGREAPAAQIDRLVAGLHTASDKEIARRKSPDRFQIRWHWDPDTGDFVLKGRLPAQDGARLMAAITASERERTRTSPEQAGPEQAAPEEPVTHANAAKKPPGDIGPALLTMADLSAAAVANPATGASSAAEVVFFHEHDTVRIPGGPALPENDTEEVLCNARLRLAKTKKGCVLSLGRRTRVTSAKQMLALTYRDGYCRTPGCGRTRFLHAHHVQFWGRGGKTDLDNLILLCGTCHRALHRDQFTITAHGDQQFEFHTPDGDVLAPSPPISGLADQLLRDGIPDNAIIPNWGGEPLHLDHAVSVILDGWAPK